MSKKRNPNKQNTIPNTTETSTGRPIVETRMTYGYPCWKGNYGSLTRNDVNERLKDRYLVFVDVQLN